MSLIGLLGSHRTGKSTLAKAYAEKHGMNFVETSVSAIFKRLGLDPAAKFTFAERLSIQEVVLTEVDKIYGKLDLRVSSITDRTPIDMLAYTLSEAIGDAVQVEDQQRLDSYIARCIDVTNKRFSTLILVQPGIPIVPEAGKAIANAGYMEHLNSLMLGLSVDERVKVPHFYIPRNRLSLESRISAVTSALNMTSKRVDRDLDQYLSLGNSMQ